MRRRWQHLEPHVVDHHLGAVRHVHGGHGPASQGERAHRGPPPGIAPSLRTRSSLNRDRLQSYFEQDALGVRENGSPVVGAASSSKAESEATIADLLDLEYELNNIHPMEGDRAGAASKDDAYGGDPFGDSFTASAKAAASGKASSASAVVPLPPPPSAKDAARPDGTGTHRRERTTTRAGSTTSTTTATVAAPSAASGPSGSSASTAYSPPPTSFSASASGPLSAPLAQEEKHWFDQETEALFDDGDLSASARLDQVRRWTLLFC